MNIRKGSTLQNIIFLSFSLAYTDRTSFPWGGQANLCFINVLSDFIPVQTQLVYVKITEQITNCFFQLTQES